MERYKIFENKERKLLFVVDQFTGKCIKETVNPETAETLVDELNSDDRL